MSQVKKFYIEHNIHQLLMPMIQKYSQALKVVANGSYALSSLVYLQPEICLDIVKHKSEMRKLIEGYRLFFSSKPVVESGACLIANLAYSNEEVKELLRQYSVV